MRRLFSVYLALLLKRARPRWWLLTGGLGVLMAMATLATTVSPWPRLASDEAGAASTGPEIVLNVQGGDCDDPMRPTSCDVGVATPFTLTVDVLGAPASGYGLLQSYVEYGALTYKKSGAVGDEVVWPDSAAVPIRHVQIAGAVGHTIANAVLPPYVKSHYTGTVLALDMNCTAAPGQVLVSLLPYLDIVAGVDGTLFVEPDGVTQVVPKVSSLTINCELPATATVPATPTSPPPPPTNTITPTPTSSEPPTPTPTPGTPLETVSSTIGANGGVLTTGIGDPVEVTLVVPQSALVSDVEITIDVFGIDDVQLPSASNDAGSFLSRAFVFSPDDLTLNLAATATFTYTDSEVAGLNEVELDVAVLDNGQWELAEVLARDTLTNTLTVSVPHFSQRQLCPDCDGDGCLNVAEEETDPGAEMTGGLRDLFHPWDFYDTNGDRRIDLPHDILGVVLRYSANPQLPYDEAYDRGEVIGEPPWTHPWNRYGPDGTIDLANDILGVIQQYQHDCT